MCRFHTAEPGRNCRRFLRMINFFQSLSIRWKFQFVFFAVTMVTTLYNRWLATGAMDEFVTIARNGGAPANVVSNLENARDSFVFNAIWESGIEFAIQFALIAVVASLFVRPIRELIEALREVSSGNLMQEVIVRNKDEIGELERHFNAVTIKLRNILEGVDNGARSMGQSAFQIATISHEIADIGKKEQENSAQVEAVTSQLVEFSQTVQNTAQSVTEGAKGMAKRAEQGITMVEDNLDTMNITIADVREVAGDVQVLSENAEQISTISDTISQIAEQTNLLALNAAIEAARAGDTGRGFAVVADEVRQLASNTAASVSEISTIIQSLQVNVAKASKAMEGVASQVELSGNKAEQIASEIQAIGTEINHAAQGSEKIVGHSSEQLESLTSLQQTLSLLFDTLGKNSAKVEVTADIGDSLYELTGEMEEIISSFTFREKKKIDRMPNEQRTHPRLDSNLIVCVRHADQEWEGLTEDISLEGVGIILNHPLEIQQGKVNLAIKLPAGELESFEKELPLELEGEVEWSKQQQDQYHYGFSFVNVSPRDKERLRQIFAFFHFEPLF